MLLVEQWLKNLNIIDYYLIYALPKWIENDKTVMLIPLIVQKKSLGIKWLKEKRDLFFGIESWSDYMNAIYFETNNLWFDFAFKEIAKQFPGLDINLNCVRDDTAISIWCAEKNFKIV